MVPMKNLSLPLNGFDVSMFNFNIQPSNGFKCLGCLKIESELVRMADLHFSAHFCHVFQ